MKVEIKFPTQFALILRDNYNHPSNMGEIGHVTNIKPNKNQTNLEVVMTVKQKFLHERNVTSISIGFGSVPIFQYSLDEIPHYITLPITDVKFL